MNERTHRLKYMLTDWVTANIAFFLFNFYRFSTFNNLNSPGFFDFVGSPKLIAEQILIPLFLLGLYWMSGFYNHPFKKSRLQELMTTLFSAMLATLLIFLALLTNDQTLIISTNYLMLITLFLLIFLFTYSGRLILTTLTIVRLRSQQWREPAIIVGASEEALSTASRIADPKINLGYDIIRFVPLPGEKTAASLPASTIDIEILPEFISRRGVKQVFIAPEKMDDRLVLSLVNLLFPLGTTIRIAPDTLDYVTSSIHLQDIYGEPFVDLASPKVSEATKNIKRSVDVLFSSFALAALALPCLVIAFLVKRSSPGPVFYRQERIGYRQKPFNILKFRTMRTDAEVAGPQLTSEHDPRVTPIGRFLRKYRLDEVPQFLNVIKGEMSIVGPRPERDFFIKQIVKQAPYYTLIHQVRPGITSWGMVKFGYASNVKEMVARTRFDLVYLANMSVSVDFKIMIYTVRTVLTGRGK